MTVSGVWVHSAGDDLSFQKKRSTSHDTLTARQSRQHFGMRCIRSAENNRSRLQTVAVLDEYDAFIVQHLNRVLGYEHRDLTPIRGDVHGDKLPRPPISIGVGQDDTPQSRTGLLPENGCNVVDAPTRRCGSLTQENRRILSGRNGAEALLEDLEIHPDRVQIGDRKRVGVLPEPFAQGDVLGDDGSVKGCA